MPPIKYSENLLSSTADHTGKILSCGGYKLNEQETRMIDFVREVAGTVLTWVLPLMSVSQHFEDCLKLA